MLYFFMKTHFTSQCESIIVLIGQQTTVKRDVFNMQLLFLILILISRWTSIDCQLMFLLYRQ